MSAQTDLPGVTTFLENRYDTEVGVVAKACFRTFGACQPTDSTPEHLARAVEVASQEAVLHAAALALPIVGLDWNKLIRLGLRIIENPNHAGTVETIDFNAETATVNWGSAFGTGEVFTFQGILERLEDRRWRVE